MKTDILREIMYFSYDPSSLANLYPLYAEDVWDIIRMNREGIKPESLKNDADIAAPEFVTAVGDDAINRFDEARKRKKKKKSRGGNGAQKKAEQQADANQPKAEHKEPKKEHRQEPREPKESREPREHKGGPRNHKGGHRNGGNRRNDHPKKEATPQGE
jgi:hypothetical protein